MSDQTVTAVRDAEAAVVQARAETSQLKRQCLSAIADLLPGQADAIAKRLAHTQPATTKALGPSGVKALRGQIAARAGEIAAELRESEHLMEWPRSHEAAPRDVCSAFFKYLYGRRLAALARGLPVLLATAQTSLLVELLCQARIAVGQDGGIAGLQIERVQHVSASKLADRANTTHFPEFVLHSGLGIALTDSGWDVVDGADYPDDVCRFEVLAVD